MQDRDQWPGPDNIPSDVKIAGETSDKGPSNPSAASSGSLVSSNCTAPILNRQKCGNNLKSSNCGMALWDNEAYGSQAHKVCWFLFAFTSVVITLRFYSRFTAKPNNWFGAMGLDDALVGFSWIVLLLTQVFIQIAADYGNGKHFDDLSKNSQIQAMKWNTIIDAVIIWAFSLPKLAIIALLRRILNFGLHTSVLLWGLAFVGQALIFSMSVFVFIQCDPAAKNWDTDLPGICLPRGTMIALEYFVSSYSAFLDLFLAVFPAPFIMRLNMPLKTRLAVSGALGLGVFASIIQGYKLSIMGASFQLSQNDPTYPLPFLNTFGMLEACLLLIAGSLPALGPLIRHAKDHLSRLTSSKGWSVTEIGEYVSNRSKRSQLDRTQDERKPSRTPGPLGYHGYNVEAAPSRRKGSDNSDQQTLTHDDLESSIESRPSAVLDSPTNSSPTTELSPRPVPGFRAAEGSKSQTMSEKQDYETSQDQSKLSEKLRDALKGLKKPEKPNVVLACMGKSG
ncbi:putative Integral membrane protein [Seiridium cardinale]